MAKCCINAAGAQKVKLLTLLALHLGQMLLQGTERLQHQTEVVLIFFFCVFCSGIDKCECLRRAGQNTKDSCNFANVRNFFW